VDVLMSRWGCWLWMCEWGHVWGCTAFLPSKHLDSERALKCRICDKWYIRSSARPLTARSTSLCSGGISPAVAPPGLCNRHFQELRYYHWPSVHALERRLVSEQRKHFSEPCSAQQRVGGDGEALLEAVPSETQGTYAQRSHAGVIPHGAVGWINLAQHGRRAITTAQVRRV